MKSIGVIEKFATVRRLSVIKLITKKMVVQSSFALPKFYLK
jgi:hypothetical protein